MSYLAAARRARDFRTLSAWMARDMIDLPIPHWKTARLPVLGGTLILTLLAASGPAAAQATAVVGGSGRPAVDVDLSVLDDYGYGGAPKLLMPGTGVERSRIKLKRPGESIRSANYANESRKALGDAEGTGETPPARGTPPIQRAAKTAPPADTLDAPPPMPELTPAPIRRPAQPAFADFGAKPAPEPVAPPTANLSPLAPRQPKAPAAPTPPTAPAMPQQMAALTQPQAAQKILFAAGSSDMGAQEQAALTALARQLADNKDQRLQLVAYATSNSDNPSEARRLSLTRALAVRSFLINQGVRPTRVDVRALGSKFESAPGDRVDIIVMQ